MRLSLTSWSFPSCTLQECAGISRALGIGALDVSLFYRSGLNKAEFKMLARQQCGVAGVVEKEWRKRLRKILNKDPHVVVRGTGAKLAALHRNLGADARRAHACQPSVRRKMLPTA